MNCYSRALGDVLKTARYKQDLTQSELADLVNADTRTILNIENYRGNPKLEVLYPLVRALNIDPWDIFYPEAPQDAPSRDRLICSLRDCSEEEAAALLPILHIVRQALHRNGEDANTHE